MRTIRLQVTHQLFDLLTDAIRNFSRNTGRFETLRSTVQHACHRIKPTKFNEDDFESFREQYAVDAKGPDRFAIWMNIAPTWQADYSALREKLEQTVAYPITDLHVIGFAIYLATTTELIKPPAR